MAILRSNARVLLVLVICFFGFWFQFESFPWKELELLRHKVQVNERKTIEKIESSLKTSLPQYTIDLFEGACTRQGKRIAVVTQFIEEDVQAIVEQLHRWLHPSYHPCVTRFDESPIDLIYFMDYPVTNAIVQPIKDKLRKMKSVLSHCFGQIRIMDSGLPYDILGQEKHWSNAEVFFAIYDKLIPLGYDYFFLMEADTHPIRADWARKLVIETNCGNEFWVKGSINRNMNALQMRSYGYHINGNALYHTCRNWEDCYRWTRYQLQNLDGMPFDFAIWWSYFNPDNVHQVRNWIHLYTISDFVQNQYHDTNWNPAEIRESSPNTYFVHGKNRVTDEGDRLVVFEG